MKPFLFIIALIITSQLNSQPLSIGDKLPPLKLSICCHPERSEGPNHLNDVVIEGGAKQPTLIAFFAPHCMASVRLMPRLDSLQKKWKDKIQVLLVTNVPLDKLRPFISNNKIARSISLPFIRDTVLTALFPCRLVPHMVWLTASGTVAAITEAAQVTSKNIGDFIAGKKLDLPVKNDIAFDRSLLLFQNGNAGDESSLTFRSSFTGYLPGLFSGSGITYNEDSSAKRIYIFNEPVLTIYRNVIPPGLQSRFVVDTAVLFTIDHQPEQSEGSPFTALFCYELVVPASTSDETIKTIMLQDFNRYLGLNGHTEKRKVNCRALVRTVNNDSLLLSKGGRQHHALTKKDTLKFIRNQTLGWLVYTLNRKGCSPVPVVDETNFSFPVDINLRIDDLCNLPALRKALVPYGLDLITVQRELDFFVLSTNKSPVKTRP